MDFKALFQLYLQLQRWRNVNKMKFFGQILPLDMVIYGHFWGQKSRFLDFFKVARELFKNRLGIVFRLKRPLFHAFSAQ